MKTAVLFKGNPSESDNVEEFSDMQKTNISAIKDVLEKSNYNNIVETDSSNLFTDLNKYSSGKDFFFYYAGHGKGGNYIGDFHKDEVFSNFSQDKNNKYVVLDSCSWDVFDEGTEFVPESSKLIFADKVRYDRGISKLMWDVVVARGKTLDTITEETFKEIQQDWIKVREN